MNLYIIISIILIFVFAAIGILIIMFPKSPKGTFWTKTKTKKL